MAVTLSTAARSISESLSAYEAVGEGDKSTDDGETQRNNDQTPNSPSRVAQPSASIPSGESASVRTASQTPVSAASTSSGGKPRALTAQLALALIASCAPFASWRVAALSTEQTRLRSSDTYSNVATVIISVPVGSACRKICACAKRRCGNLFDTCDWAMQQM
eukprot:6211887-Pleurochrysis_carterae.AAC.2